MIRVGLRVDVDTLRGTRHGVPRLLEQLDRNDAQASFFFSVGPDNMGRNLWRLLNPRFLGKMLRSRAASLYGWETLLRGAFWPGPRIGARCGELFREVRRAGHEVGLHAWDHYRWQRHLESFSEATLLAEIRKGFDCLASALGTSPSCSAVAGWQCDERTLIAKEGFGFEFNSDCRGRSIFRPRIGSRVFAPQVPVTLPTYDEMIGRDGVTRRNYNDRLLSLIRPEQLNVLTVHAEVEGIHCAALFDSFLREARRKDMRLVSLGTLYRQAGAVPTEPILRAALPGRADTVCWQASACPPARAVS